MHYIETSCKVDSNYRVACFEGIEKGYKDNEHLVSYYDGINIGVQIVSYLAQRDKISVGKPFVEGLIDGALDKENNLEAGKDSAQYNRGKVNSFILKEYIKSTEYKGDTLNDFTKGFREGAGSIGNPELYARACGKVFGATRLKIAFNYVNLQIYGTDSTKSVSKDLFYAGFMECNQPDAVIPHNKANEISVITDLNIKNRLYADNKTKGEKFLAENGKKAGISTLPSGIQYKIIKKGKGKVPTIDDKVEIHYVGKTIEGKVFTDTRVNDKPVTMPLKSANQCYKEILQMMNEGSVYEIYVPQNLAYGSTQTKYFEPFSALIYEIELIKILK